MPIKDKQPRPSTAPLLSLWLLLLLLLITKCSSRLTTGPTSAFVYNSKDSIRYNTNQLSQYVSLRPSISKSNSINGATKLHHRPLFYSKQHACSETQERALYSQQSSRSRTLRATNNNSENTDEVVTLSASTKPRVYKQRWIQLGYISALALLSDWICFSVAAAPSVYESAFPTHSAASIIDLFLFTNVASCFVVTDIVRKIGLQRSIQASAILMTIGCWLRCGGLRFLGDDPSMVTTYPYIVLGTVLVGFAQPFFQCTPPLLSATWFASTERATSTAIALNFNQIGIALAFLVGGGMAVNTPGLENYFGLIAVVCTAITAGTLLQFQNEPPVPPSQSELEKKLNNEIEPPFLTSAQRFFQKNGFTHALLAFICSISVTNVVGAFIEDIAKSGGLSSQTQIDFAGAGFELAILLGGIFIGGYVDRTKQYKNVTLACLVASLVFLVPIGLSSPGLGTNPVIVLLALLGLGLVVGPVQPINAELAVDVTYPGDETAVESVQQIGGNMISALLIPVAEYLKEYGTVNIPPSASGTNISFDGDIILLFAVTIATIIYFSSFNATLARSKADE